MVEEVLIPVIAILSVIALPVVAIFVLGLRKLSADHAERIGLINQGIIPPDNPKPKSTPNRFVSLRNGIVLVALGIGVVVGFVCTEYLTIGETYEFWIIAASILFFLGLGYLSYFLVTKKMGGFDDDVTDQD
ncbi:DUF6249 domain-containing protein [Limibacterium fermenti]|jgi:hypothetical protein|uniref:DUF6249 domain-containing protein n=1 Tax=Limibacterium fermenti TaxID=3229863 RepID=UPI000E9FDAAC|nr:hypothetical protein [Porphyromonadaceae bacterium]HBK30707.1 hypothetical protein [Porphyromonadaceae bacterium]HBX20357.1 hypothetical protein [Porphyromonadaceae bacterium]HBX45909.1 hypothetical protein [Porphyromonadaceae bacterium]HCM21508.1 hypothetical protein [Porphyromonadaceae bacterium]